MNVVANNPTLSVFHSTYPYRDGHAVLTWVSWKAGLDTIQYDEINMLLKASRSQLSLQHEINIIFIN